MRLLAGKYGMANIAHSNKIATNTYSLALISCMARCSFSYFRVTIICRYTFVCLEHNLRVTKFCNLYVKRYRVHNNILMLYSACMVYT